MRGSPPPLRATIGTNRRYAHVIDAQMEESALKVVARNQVLQTLTPMELRLSDVPFTIDPRFGTTPVRVNAVAARCARRSHLLPG